MLSAYDFAQRLAGLNEKGHQLRYQSQDGAPDPKPTEAVNVG